MPTSRKPRRTHVLAAAAVLVLTSSLSLHSLAAPAKKVRGPEVIPGEIVVKFRDGSLGSLDAATDADAKADRAHARANARALRKSRRLRMHLVRGQRGQSTAELLNAYAAMPEVEYAEPNYVIHLNADTPVLPNDPQFPSQWALRNVGQTGGTQGVDIDAPLAWGRSTGSDAVVVADIDSGVAYDHPDLAANMWRNPGEIAGNRIDDDRNGYVDDVYGWNFASNTANPYDDNGHGTHTAGTFGAVGNNGVGVTGVAWKVKIMALKFLTANGSGGSFEAAQAIDYASRMGARVASASWGGGSYSQAIEDALRNANQRGMLFVTAAGNDGLNVDTNSSYPCKSAQPNVLCVAATDASDRRASFSNYGATNVDIAAPGVSILSTVPTGSCGMCNSTGYRTANGTSMATPHVSGAAALAFSRFPRLTPTEVKSLLMNSADKVTSLQSVSASGGRLNVAKAIANRFVVSSLKSELTVTAGGEATLSVDLRSLDGVSRTVTLALTGSTGLSMAPITVSIPTSGIAVATVRVQAAAGMNAGSYPVTLVATDGATGETSRLPLGVVVAGSAATVSAADLVIAQISTTTLAVTAGTDAILPYMVANKGSASAGGFYIGLYLSTDARIDASDRYLGRRWIPGLTAGGNAPHRTIAPIPAGTAPGTYYIGAIADMYNVVPEANETNNASASNAFQVQ